MLNILISSFAAGVGSYLLRKGNLLGLMLFIFKRHLQLSDINFGYTCLGIILNLVAIFFWQYSAKSNLPYSVAYSIYLSVALIVGIITSSILERINLGINILIGTFLVIVGITIMMTKN